MAWLVIDRAHGTLSCGSGRNRPTHGTHSSSRAWTEMPWPITHFLLSKMVHLFFGIAFHSLESDGLSSHASKPVCLRYFCLRIWTQYMLLWIRKCHTRWDRATLFWIAISRIPRLSSITGLVTIVHAIKIHHPASVVLFHKKEDWTEEVLAEFDLDSAWKPT